MLPLAQRFGHSLGSGLEYCPLLSEEDARYSHMLLFKHALLMSIFERFTPATRQRTLTAGAPFACLRGLRTLILMGFVRSEIQPGAERVWRILQIVRARRR